MRRAVRALSVAYLVALVALVIALWGWGDSWWPLGVLLYLPRVGFGLPLFLLWPSVLIWRSRTAAWSLALSTLLVVFPLMGLTWSLAPHAAEGPTLRVLTFNVYFMRHGVEGVLREVAEAKPDVILF